MTFDPLLWRHAVLCSHMLGGAEIFTLERMLALGGAPVLRCNTSLAGLIRQDQRYAEIDVRPVSALDALATSITWAHLRIASSALASAFGEGGVLLGNLRASALQLVSRWAGRNAIFVHDNTHHLNARARWMITLAGLRSSAVYFPCRFASARLPLRALLASRLQVEYFAPYHPATVTPVPADGELRIVNVGRIEPNKNQLLAVSIASRLAASFRQVRLTLLGAVTDDAYARTLLGMARPANLAIEVRHVLRAQVPQVLRAHHLLLHTSLIESLPLVLFEASSAGVPCFAVDAGGITELIPASSVLPAQAEAAADCMLRQLRPALESAT